MTTCTRIAYGLLAVAVLFVTTKSSATCTAQLSGSLDVYGVYNGTLMTGDDQFLGGGGYETLNITLDGTVIWSQQVYTGAPQQFTVTFPTACWTPASHTLTTYRGCDNPVRSNTTVDTSADIPTIGGLRWVAADSESDLLNNPPGTAGTIQYSYTFPHTDSSSERVSQLYIDGVYQTSFNESSTSGTASHYFEACLNGSHELKVRLITCGLSSKVAQQAVTLNLNNQPILAGVGFTPDGLAVQGRYSFPYTDGYSGRSIVVFVNGVRRAYDSGLSGGWPASGGLDFRNFQAGCISSVRFELSSKCSSTIQATVGNGGTNPTLALALKSTGTASVEATLTWDLHNYVPGYTISLRVLKWYDAQGVEHDGYDIGAPIQVGTVSGTSTPTFTPLGDWQQVVVQATMASCRGDIERTASARRCCDAKSHDPVFFIDGDVRYTETDPLPALGGATSLQRTYDSQKSTAGLFGVGWSSMFDRRLAVDSVTPAGGSITHSYAYLNTVNDAMVAFENVGGTYVQTLPDWESSAGTLNVFAAGTDPGGDPGTIYEYRPANGRVASRFRETDKRFAGTRDVVTGRVLTITYANGAPVTAADSWSGTTWNLTVTNGLITAITVSGRPDLAWSYQYDAAGHLTAVLAGSATYRTYSYSSARNSLTDVRDGAGNLIETHTYDGNGRAVSSTGRSDEIQTIAYNGSTTTVTMNTGAVMTYDFNAIGSAWRPAHVSGGCAGCGERDSGYAYDDDGHVIRQQFANGYIDTSAYLGGRLVSRTSHLRRSDCDPATATNCLLTSSTDLLNALLIATNATTTTTYAYDPLWTDRVTSMTSESVAQHGSVRNETLTLDGPTGEILTRTITGWTGLGTGLAQEQHTTTTTLYDGTETAAFNPGGAFDSAWLSIPQPAKMRKSVDGPRTSVSDVTTFVYYPIYSSVTDTWRGRLAAVRNAAGQITRYENYDVFGNPGRIVDPNGVATESTFDLLGRSLTTTLKGVSGCNTTDDPLCSTDLTTSRTYSAGTGPLLTQTDARDNVVTYEYDARTRVSATSRGPSLSDLRERIEYTYDAATGLKNLEKYLARENNTWVEKRRESYTYDPLSQLHAQTHADNTNTAYGYDALGAVVSLQDENHTTANTRYRYDAAQRLASVDQKLGGGSIITSYAYDVAGNLSSVTDPNGNVTTYAYDDFGQMLAQVSPVTGTTTYAYDAAGNLTSSTDANNAVTTRTYDVLNRVLTSVATVGSSSETTTWTYDRAVPFGLGPVGSMTDAAGNATYSYDRRGLLLSDSRTSGAVLLATSFQYDASGNRSFQKYPSGISVAYTYDFAGRPLTLTSGGLTYLSGATYLPFGPETSLSFSNGTTQTRVYDSRFRIQRNTLTGPAGTIADYSYSEDNVGNITSIHDALDASYNRDFVYDDLNRLTSANSGPSLWGAGSYHYDSMGNLLSRDLGGSVEVDPNNPLSRTRRFSATPDSLPAPGSIHETYGYTGTTSRLATVTSGGIDHPITYDAAGNELRYFDPRTYSPRNLMSSITEPSEDDRSHTVTYTYDGRGVRLIRSEGTTGYTTPFANRYYVYSPELQLISVSVDDNPNIWGKSAISNFVPQMKSEIVWFNGRPVAQLIDGSTIRYTFTDHLGTPILQTDPNAQVMWRAEYEPYGDLWNLRAGTAAEQPLRFPGQEYESRWEGTEEHYNIARWFRAGLGNYTQADPLGLSGGINVYQYSIRNPISFFDPTGLVTVVRHVTKNPVNTLQDLDMRCRMTNGGVSGGGCTPTAYAIGHCTCRCFGPTDFRPDTVIDITATQYAFNGPWLLLRRSRTPHPSVHDYVSALAHEDDFHLNPTTAKLIAEVAQRERTSYPDQATCDSQGCTPISQFVSQEFSRLIRESQRIEETGGDPRQGLP